VTALLRILNPASHARGLRDGLALFRRHARLTLEMAKRDLTQRYAGQLIGSIWVVGHPLFLTLLYVFLFGTVFKVKVGGTAELPLDYTAYMLSGLIPWLTFQTAMSASCVSIVSNASLVKQFIFPLEVLPAKDVLTATVIWIVGMITILVYVVATHGLPPATWLLLPILFVLQLLAMIGVALLLSATTVFFRDLKDLIQLFTTIGLFLMPVVYLPAMVPPAFRPLLYVNPFSYMTWAYQDALYFGRIDHPYAWVLFAAGSVIAFAMGFRVFQRLKPMFASAL
jgi:lipopolysaccharide transport system permease protein